MLEIQSGTVILTGLTFIRAHSDLGGGLMIWDGSNVTLANSQVLSNTATSAGGGIFKGGVLAQRFELRLVVSAIETHDPKTAPRDGRT